LTFNASDKCPVETDSTKHYSCASGFSKLDDNVASVLPRTQIFKSCEGVFESENLLVNDWLEIDLVFCEEIAEILLILCRSDADAPGMRSVVLRE